MTQRFLPALFVLPALASCSFLLDFGSLQKGSGGGAGAAGRAGSGSNVAGSSSGGTPAEGGAPEGATGGSGPAGAGGNGTCPAECFHNDPCLESGCDAEGNCLTGKNSGLTPDGVDMTVSADTHYRVTLIGGDSAFYLSNFETTGGKPEVTFYELDATTKSFTTLATLGGLGITSMGDPVSAAGLAFQPVVGVLHGFVAIGERVGKGARVWHIVLGTQDNLPKPAVIGNLTDGYYSDSPYNYPSALFLNNQTAVAWINADQTISLGDGTVSPPQKLSAATQATTLSLLGDDAESPAVLYTAAGGGVFVEQPGAAPYAVPECQPAAGDYASCSATSTTIPGVWIGAWTKYTSGGNGYLTTNGRGLACLAGTCTSDMNACPANSADNGVRDPASVIAHRPGDPTNLLEVVTATPLLTTDGTQVLAELVLTQQNTNLGDKPLQSPPTTTDLGPPVQLASMTTTADSSYAGPDWPAVAFVPPDRYAVSWIQPGAKGDELRLRRFRMCVK
jgi:hypothetical protein